MSVDEKLTSVFLSVKGGLARAVTGIVPPKEIEDVVQETYVRVCQSQNGAEIRSPRSFMFRTARNIALNYVNCAESRLVREFDDEERVGDSSVPGVARDTLEQVCTDEEFVQFCDAVRRLPLQCRRAFVLKKVYGHTQREIAEIMEVSEKTVENHIAKGQKRCRQYLLQRKAEDRGSRLAGDAVGEGA